MKGAGEKASLVQSLKFGVGIRLFMKKSLLVIVAALTCASVLAQDAAKSPGAAGQLGWQMAIHAYTFRKFSIYECIDKTAELGLKHMSLSGSVSLDGKKSVPTVSLPDGDAEAIKKAVAAKGITLVNIGVVKLPAAEAESRKVFEFAKKMGIDTLVAEPEPDALDTVEKLCKEYNIKVAIHNHPKPSRYWNPDTVLEAVKGRTPLMGSCADTGHWLRSGLNPLECLKKLDGRVICLHFKDNNISGLKGHNVPWGTGDTPLKDVLQLLKTQKYKFPANIELEYRIPEGSDAVAEVKKCLAYAKNCLV